MKVASVAALVSAASLLVSGTSSVADEDPAKLAGNWTVDSFEFNGTPVAEMMGAIREFTGENYTLTPKSGQTYKGTFKLDPTQTPKQIDLVLSDRTLRGIYELDGAQLKLAYALEGDARPTEFASKPDSGVVLVVHQRTE